MDPLGALISSVAACGGALGLFSVALFERFVPWLPSTGMLAAIGVAAEQGLWSVPTALLASTVGSVLGCIAFYSLTAALGEARSAVLLSRTARLFGISQSRMQGLTGYCRNHGPMLAFGAQLVPVVRLIAPGVAGLMRAETRTFIAASACGVALWNGLFIGVGYAASHLMATINVSSLALGLLVALFLGEVLAFAAWRGLRRRAAARASDPQRGDWPPD